MDLFVYGIWVAVMVLGTIFSVHLRSANKDHSTATIHKNMGLINFFCFAHLSVITILWFKHFDPQEQAYRFLFQLNSALLVILTAAAYYIYKVPFFSSGEIGLFWKKNPYAGSNRPGFLDPANKVETEAEKKLKGDREATFRSLEIQEVEFIQSKETLQREHGRIRPPRDNINRSGYQAYGFLEYVKYRRHAPAVPVAAGLVAADPALLRGKVDLTPASDIKEAVWWVENHHLKCYNTFTEVPGPDVIPQVGGVPSLEAHPSAIFINCVSVDRPEQVTPAINLIQTTLKHIPYYTINEPSRNQFKYSVAVDCEFLQFHEFYQRGLGATSSHSATTSYHLQGGYDFDENGNVKLDKTLEIPNPLPVEEDDFLISCISVSVDKVLVVNFHILHMIQNIHTHLALEQVTSFFTDFILNPRIIKFWFNLQRDIKAMDSTLEEIYRGTPREPFSERISVPTMLEYKPRYKLKLRGDQAAIFGRTRPENTSFGGDARWGTSCPYGFHTNAVDSSQRPCPCRTNNLDLAVVTEFIMRDIGLQAPHDGNPYNKRAWTDIRNAGNFKDFKRCLLIGDRHEELFQAFEGACLPNSSEACIGRACGQVGAGCVDGCPNKELWKKSISDRLRRFANPDFQRSHTLLGHVAGNVISIAMVARFLMTTQNPRLLLERLRLWSIKPRGTMGEVTFTRTVESLVPQKVDVLWKPGSNLVGAVPLYIENKAFAEKDLIEWVEDRVLIGSIHSSGLKATFLRSETELKEILSIFMRRLPRILGEYVVERIVLKPDSTQYRQSDRQFTINQIREIFNAPRKSLMTSQLLQMAIAYFELKVIHEYENDKQRVDAMDRQFEASRLAIGSLLGVPDNEVILRAKGALITPSPQPDWISRNPDLLPNTLMDVNKTANGLFLKPTQPIDFPDDFRRGSRRMRDLLDSLLDLQELGEHRVEEFKRLMGTMVDIPNKVILENATLYGITHFQFPYLKRLLPPRSRGMDTTNIIDNNAMVLFWILLVFKTTDDGGGVRTRSESLAQRVFDLTFSPTNFYMPELHQIIKRATPTNLHERAQPARDPIGVIRPARNTANVGSRVNTQKNQAPMDEGWMTDEEDEQNDQVPVLPVVPEPRLAETALPAPRPVESTRAVEDELYPNSVKFDIDHEGVEPELQDAETSGSDERAQFLRVLRQTIETWCL